MPPASRAAPGCRVARGSRGRGSNPLSPTSSAPPGAPVRPRRRGRGPSLRLQRPDLLERECDGFWDEVSDIVAEGCDLANAGGADEHELQITHQIDLLDLRSHVLVHERLIELDR